MTLIESRPRHDVAPLRKVAAVYCRISQDRSGEGLGVERQEQACRDLADRLGWDVEYVLVDNDASAISGKKRPGWVQLLDLLRTGQVDGVLAYHVDRLYRRTLDLMDFIPVVERSGADVKTVMAGDMDLGTSTGRLIAKMLCNVAEAEAERIGERVKERQKQAAEEGAAPGGRFVHYGYKRAGRGVLVIDEAQAAVVREIVARVLKGDALDAIADTLNKRGVPTSSGKGRWHGSPVRSIVTSPTIAGMRAEKGEVVNEKASWEGIIDVLTHRRVVAKLSGPPRSGQPTKYLLTGILFCGRCGEQLRSHSGHHSTTGRVQRNYACIKDTRWPNACGALSASMVAVDSILTGWTLAALTGAKVPDLVASRSSHSESRLSAQITADRELLAQLADDYGNRVFSRAEFLAARAPVMERIDTAEAKLRRIAASTTPLPADLVTVTPESWEQLEFEVQRELVRLIVGRVEVAPATKRGRLFDTSRLIHAEFNA